MKLANEFVVASGVERTWELLNDLEQVAPCLPGAAITGRDGESFLGTVKIKVGPIGAHLQGVAKFVDTDESARTAVISMSGKDTKGSTATDATMRVRLEPVDSQSTRVWLDTDLDISGRMAQFGRGAIADVSNRLIGQFTDNLGALIAAEPNADTGGTPPPPSPDSAGPGAKAGPEPASSATAGGLDLLSVLGPTVARQAAPVLAGLAVGFLLGQVGRRRRPRREGVVAIDPWADARLNAWLETRLDARGVR